MPLAMGVSSIVSAPPSLSSNSNSNSSSRVLRVITSSSLRRLPLASRPVLNPPCIDDHGSRYLTSLTPCLRRPRKYIIMAANSSVEPAPSAPSNPWDPIGRKGWIAGIVLTMLLPFTKSKWGPLSLFKDKLDEDLQKVEDTVEAIEKVAERLEKATEDLAEKLPDGTLKDAVNFVEHAAEEVAKDLKLADAAIDKIQELEVKAEAFVNSRSENASRMSGEAKADNELA